MAGNILYSGFGLMKSAFAGLMDSADPAVQQKLATILDRECAADGLTYHNLRHRNVGDAHWVDLHLLFPNETSLSAAHRKATRIEEVIEQSLEPRAYVTTHLECAADHDEIHPRERIGADKPAG